MVFTFILFYIIIAVLLYFGYKDLFIPLVGLIFLFGALFVLFVSHISYVTLHDLVRTTASKNQLKKKNDELAQYARLISHDLKSPLRNIGSFAQILKKECADKMTDESEECLDIIINSSQNMYKMLEELSVHNKLKTGNEKLVLNPVNLNTVIKEVLFSIQRTIKEENVEFDVQQNLPNIHANPVKLKLVFQNLIDNAIKYNRNSKKLIKIYARNNEYFTIISITDNGIGIEEKYHEKIFKVFERLHGKNEFSGTGIGLANVFELIEQFGGKITVDSIPEKGSTFNIHFPII